ncbi:metallophosphoesterase family protein [Loigolactobacillus coryniformis]|jgi:calcineurin-like phosphoesterase family protein|nr:metallophosphoesterase [Loigolactobacillus coryniformis]ATO44159.1 metallophosphatase [Loigolactobacillus coryniformis subsp. torquens DSM 20004 = KCTC 3535]ATO55826.1 metallophosphatase [Loigolactobacillus coryniformis subsp. coryniformis KCTC 3167 = DSM 20001]MDC4185365.1 metallophosphoesterase family protein [Loigolactobacillus coryniformis]
MQYFTADTHFFHEQLLGNNDFAPRLFDSVEEMNQAIITAWNRRVTDRDIVYHLGDIAMRPSNYPGNDEVLEVLQQLNGQLILIKGNHDNRALFKFLAKHNSMIAPGRPKFQFHDVGVLIKANHFQFFMTHYPLMMGIVKQTMNLHGHIHHSSVPLAENINVGVDAPELDLLAHKLPFGTPLSVAEIFEIYTKKAALLAKQHKN